VLKVELQRVSICIAADGTVQELRRVRPVAPFSCWNFTDVNIASAYILLLSLPSVMHLIPHYRDLAVKRAFFFRSNTKTVNTSNYIRNTAV